MTQLTPTQVADVKTCFPDNFLETKKSLIAYQRTMTIFKKSFDNKKMRKTFSTLYKAWMTSNSEFKSKLKNLDWYDPEIHKDAAFELSNVNNDSTH